MESVRLDRPTESQPTRPVTSPSTSTRLPTRLATALEARSGESLDDVRVHHDSPSPGLLGALAFTKGDDIHLAPGQQEHLAHEAWHVVQQRQGRVRPTTRIAGVSVNDTPGLEGEARAVASGRVKRLHTPDVPSSDTGDPPPAAKRVREMTARRVASSPNSDVVQLRIAGLDHIRKVGDIPADWLVDFRTDMTNPTTHLFHEDIVSYLDVHAAGWSGGVAFENKRTHWNVTFQPANGPPIVVQTMADGSCGVHVIHAVMNRGAIQESAQGYLAPPDFVTPVREAVRDRLTDDEIRTRILEAIERSPNSFESGLGPLLQERIGAHERRALQAEAAEAAEAPRAVPEDTGRAAAAEPAAGSARSERSPQPAAAADVDAATPPKPSTEMDPEVWVTKTRDELEALPPRQQFAVCQAVAARLRQDKQFGKGSALLGFMKDFRGHLKGALDDLDRFMDKHLYVSNKRLEPHELFDHLTVSLYPKQKTNEQMPKQSYRKVAHRPILDVEFVGDRFYARCYLGLYGKATEEGRKDITADDSGKIAFKDIGLMNLGNPFKALLWCEDYLKSKEHAGKVAPKPVIRSFLVPLDDASWMLDDDSTEARPLDQDRGAGQFGHPGDTSFYAERLHPLVGSLVSFFLDVKEYQEESVRPGQRVIPMPVLQHYLTGHVGDPRDMATGVVAQHQRKGHVAEFAPKYHDPLTAYYDSVAPKRTPRTIDAQREGLTEWDAARERELDSGTGFSDATQSDGSVEVGKYAKDRTDLEQLDLTSFPSIARHAASPDAKRGH